MDQVELWSSQLWTQFLQLRKEAWKIQDFNGVWTRDLAIPVQCSNQLSYEATDVESWSFVGTNVPVRNESTMKWFTKMDHIWTADMKSSEAMILAVMNAIFAGFEPVSSQYRCNALTNWAMKPLPFRVSLCHCKNCIHNCEDHSFAWNDKIVTYLTNGWEMKCYECFCVFCFFVLFVF